MLQRNSDQSGLDYWGGTYILQIRIRLTIFIVRFTSPAILISKSAILTLSQKMYQCVLFRQPNDPPDGNFAGRDFWANTMASAQASGKALLKAKAILLEAFLASTEYNNFVGQKYHCPIL